MSSVDDRVVKMVFDNAAFEQKIASTMQSLDKLKGSLDFANSTRGLNDLSSATKNFSMGNMASAVDGISTKFLALSAVAITTIANITNRAVNAGLNIAKAFSVQPIMDGFREYETNINSIQTILANTASKGTGLEDVNAALDELNAYADQTIYNFSEMTRNIGTFTAAGIDLDTSVQGIKGIANLAAISGSNSQQASTAMYQLSQALASGTVKLMDWNSVVNAGMGGEVFQKALFETGKALGTIKDVPMSQTFDEWKEAGNTFRGSLEEGWITAEVLTNTLSGFTGDLTEAQVLALGYTKEQAAEILKMGQIGKDAATKVKTLTQLIGTVKEAVGSGWSSSFRIIIGDFEQAKELFSGVSDVIGKMVGDSADARNQVLRNWAEFGGRAALLDALKNSFTAVMNVLGPIKEGFRQIFPRMTADRLIAITVAFREFTEKLIIGEKGMFKVRNIARALFGALEIGWTIIKEGVGAFKELFSYFADKNNVTGGGVVDFIENIANKLFYLNYLLVEGGGIKRFFDKFVEAVKDPSKFIDELKTKVENFFKGIDFGSIDGIKEAFDRIKDSIVDFIDGIDTGILDSIGNTFKKFFGHFDPQVTNSMDGGLSRAGDRLSWFGDVLSKIWGVIQKAGDVFGWFWDKFVGIKDFVVDAVQGIGDAFSGLGPALVEFFRSEDFDQIIEVAKVAIAGIFANGFKNIATDGLKLDFTGGALTNLSETFGAFKTSTIPAITRSLDGLSGTLKTMQTNLKADTLMKIAISIGVLTASVVVLSTIDAEALAKAMGALAVGFGQLMGAMAILTAVSSGPKTAASIGIIAGGMILLAGAILILSVAMKILSTMSWEEIGKGLAAITGLLGGLVAAMNLMPDSGAMIRAGIGMIAISVAVGLLAVSMKIFATMSWEELGKGLTGVAAGLGLIAGAMNLMPKGMLTKSAGVLLVAIALNALAGAVKIFATMEWEELGKGFAAVAAGLLIIAGAMNLMPVSMVLTGPALLAVAVALNILAGALKIMATMSWEEIAKSMVVLAGALITLGIGLTLMSGTVGGAIALGIAAVSLGLMAQVLKEFAKMKWKDLLKGLAGLAAVFAVLGISALVLAPVIPALLGLGIALLLIGGGLALFGLGASLAAGAFAVLAEAGEAGIGVLLTLLDAIIARLPEFLGQFALGIAQMALLLLEQAPPIIEAIGEVIKQLLITVTDLIPELAATFTAFIIAGLQVLRDTAPDFITTGITLLLALLTGIRDNIGQITTLGTEILTNFINALADNVEMLVNAAVNLMTAFLDALAGRIGDVVTAGLNLLVALLQGISDNLGKVIPAAVDILTTFITEVGKGAGDLITAGKQVIIDLITGFGEASEDIVTAGVDTVIAFIEGLASNALRLANAAADVLIDFINGLATAIETHSDELRDAGMNLAGAIIDGMTLGLSSKAQGVIDDAKGLGDKVLGAISNPFDWNSPSKTMIKLGTAIDEGLSMGIDRGASAESSARAFSDRVSTTFQETLDKIPDSLAGMGELSPTITPVLDMAGVKASLGQMDGLLANSTITADLSTRQASALATATRQAAEDRTFTPDTPVVPQQVTFEQNNYSPKALSTADIYRQTRSQIAIAKKELNL